MPRMMVKKGLFYKGIWPENFERYIPNRFVSFFISGKNSRTNHRIILTFAGKKYIQGDYFEGCIFCDISQWARIFEKVQVKKLVKSNKSISRNFI